MSKNVLTCCIIVLLSCIVHAVDIIDCGVTYPSFHFGIHVVEQIDVAKDIVDINNDTITDIVFNTKLVGGDFASFIFLGPVDVNKPSTYVRLLANVTFLYYTDFDRDGNMEVVYRIRRTSTNFTDNTIILSLKNIGFFQRQWTIDEIITRRLYVDSYNNSYWKEDGTITGKTFSVVGFQNVSSALDVFGDFDGDGVQEVLCNVQVLTSLLSTGYPTFTLRGTACYNHPERVKDVTSFSSSVYLPNIPYNISFIVNTTTYSPLVVDLDQNGVSDIAFFGFFVWNPISISSKMVYYGNVDEKGSPLRDACLCDVNGDTYPDFVSADGVLISVSTVNRSSNTMIYSTSFVHLQKNPSVRCVGRDFDILVDAMEDIQISYAVGSIMVFGKDVISATYTVRNIDVFNGIQPTFVNWKIYRQVLSIRTDKGVSVQAFMPQVNKTVFLSSQINFNAPLCTMPISWFTTLVILVPPAIVVVIVAFIACLEVDTRKKVRSRPYLVISSFLSSWDVTGDIVYIIFTFLNDGFYSEAFFYLACVFVILPTLLVFIGQFYFSGWWDYRWTYLGLGDVSKAGKIERWRIVNNNKAFIVGYVFFLLVFIVEETARWVFFLLVILGDLVGRFMVTNVMFVLKFHYVTFMERIASGLTFKKWQDRNVHRAVKSVNLANFFLKMTLQDMDNHFKDNLIEICELLCESLPMFVLVIVNNVLMNAETYDFAFIFSVSGSLFSIGWILLPFVYYTCRERSIRKALHQNWHAYFYRCVRRIVIRDGETAMVTDVRSTLVEKQ